MTAFAVLVAAQVAAVAWFARRNLGARQATAVQPAKTDVPPDRPDYGSRADWVLAA